MKALICFWLQCGRQSRRRGSADLFWEGFSRVTNFSALDEFTSKDFFFFLLTGNADSIFLHSFYNFVYYLISWPNKSLIHTVLTALGQNLKVCILLLTYLSFVEELWQSQHSIATQLFIHPNYLHKKHLKNKTSQKDWRGEQKQRQASSQH